MKKILLLFSLLMFTFNSYADDKYVTAMKKNLAMLDTASTAASFQLIANSFERIANAEKDEWLPYYYASYLLTVSTFIDTVAERKDSYLDKADLLITLADSLQPDNSEIYTVKAVISQGRLIVDPQNRWMKYGPMFSNLISKARELDPTNPRPVFVYAQSVFYTPEQFGGGKDKALPIFKEAEEKFKNFVPESELHPNWGEEVLKRTLEEIEGE